MPLTEEFKIDWESRDIIGIDPDVDITTKILVKDNSPSNALINILLVGTRLNLFPVNGLIGYGEVYDKTDKSMSSGITEKLAREMYTVKVTKIAQDIFNNILY